jgi:hypothetical protein
LTPAKLGKADLLRVQSGVPEGGDVDELVPVPPAGVAELDVERLSGRGDHFTVDLRQDGRARGADSSAPPWLLRMDRWADVYVRV